MNRSRKRSNPDRLIRGILIFLLTITPAVPFAKAAVPSTMSYQGILKDSSGNFLTGTYSMVFKIYDVSTGGTALWTETQSSVSVSSGKFSVSLGSVTPISLDFDEGYWLSIKVGTDAEMTPRIQLTSVGYAYMAENVVNGFSQTQHDALSHKDIEGVRENTILIAKSNFKLDAYALSSANSMGEMIIDTFTDSSGIHAGSSSGYTWRGSSNYDVVLSQGGIDAYAVLAIHSNGSDASTSFTDSSSGTKTVTANGNAQIDTAQSKFGSASTLFDGTGDYLTVADSNDWDMGTGAFTVDFWVRFSSLPTQPTMTGFGGAYGDAGSLWITYYSSLLYVYVGTEAKTFSWTPSTNTWYHVAFVRDGSSNLYAFVNGSQIGSTLSSSQNITGGTGGVYVGYSNGGGDFLPGWIDELRISKGIARWTSNFTAPSAEYTSGGGSATVISNAYTEASAPTEVMVIADETLGAGSITYYVSRDNGTTWTACTKETVTSISSQPSGTQLKWKAVMTDDAELNAIAVAV